MELRSIDVSSRSLHHVVVLNSRQTRLPFIKYQRASMVCFRIRNCIRLYPHINHEFFLYKSMLLNHTLYRLWEHWRHQKSFFFRQAHNQVHVLDCLPGSAFHQVVHRPHYNHAFCTWINHEIHINIIAAFDLAYLRTDALV